MTKKEIEQWRKYSEWVDENNLRVRKRRQMLNNYISRHYLWLSKKPWFFQKKKLEKWKGEKPKQPLIWEQEERISTIKQKTEIGFREWLIKQ